MNTANWIKLTPVDGSTMDRLKGTKVPFSGYPVYYCIRNGYLQVWPDLPEGLPIELGWRVQP